MNKNYRINFQYMGGECIEKDEWEFDKAIIKINKKGMRRKGINKELWLLGLTDELSLIDFCYKVKEDDREIILELVDFNPNLHEQVINVIRQKDCFDECKYKNEKYEKVMKKERVKNYEIYFYYRPHIYCELQRQYINKLDLEYQDTNKNELSFDEMLF